MLGGIVPHLASPRTILGEKKFGVKFFLSTQDGMKHAEMHKKVKVGKNFLEVKKKFGVKNPVGRGGPAMDRQLTSQSDK